MSNTKRNAVLLYLAVGGTASSLLTWAAFSLFTDEGKERRRRIDEHYRLYPQYNYKAQPLSINSHRHTAKDAYRGTATRDHTASTAITDANHNTTSKPASLARFGWAKGGAESDLHLKPVSEVSAPDGKQRVPIPAARANKTFTNLESSHSQPQEESVQLKGDKKPPTKSTNQHDNSRESSPRFADGATILSNPSARGVIHAVANVPQQRLSTRELATCCWDRAPAEFVVIKNKGASNSALKIANKPISEQRRFWASSKDKQSNATVTSVTEQSGNATDDLTHATSYQSSTSGGGETRMPDRYHDSLAGCNLIGVSIGDNLGYDDSLDGTDNAPTKNSKPHVKSVVFAGQDNIQNVSKPSNDRPGDLVVPNSAVEAPEARTVSVPVDLVKSSLSDETAQSATYKSLQECVATAQRTQKPHSVPVPISAALRTTDSIPTNDVSQDCVVSSIANYENLPYSKALNTSTEHHANNVDCVLTTRESEKNTLGHPLASDHLMDNSFKSVNPSEPRVTLGVWIDCHSGSKDLRCAPTHDNSLPSQMDTQISTLDDKLITGELIEETHVEPIRHHPLESAIVHAPSMDEDAIDDQASFLRETGDTRELGSSSSQQTGGTYTITDCRNFLGKGAPLTRPHIDGSTYSQPDGCSTPITEDNIYEEVIPPQERTTPSFNRPLEIVSDCVSLDNASTVHSPNSKVALVSLNETGDLTGSKSRELSPSRVNIQGLKQPLYACDDKNSLDGIDKSVPIRSAPMIVMLPDQEGIREINTKVYAAAQNQSMELKSAVMVCSDDPEPARRNWRFSETVAILAKPSIETDEYISYSQPTWDRLPPTQANTIAPIDSFSIKSTYEHRPAAEAKKEPITLIHSSKYERTAPATTEQKKDNSKRAPNASIPVQMSDVSLNDSLDTADDLDTSYADNQSTVSGGSVEFSRTQQTETEEMIETSVEETVTMVITGVVANPGEDEEVVLSLQDAVGKGLLDLNNGLYLNSNTGRHISLVEAMNTGLIKMGPKKVTKSKEEVKSVGIITIKTSRETIPYNIKAAADTRTGSMLTTDEAKSLGILDSVRGSFTDLKTGNQMLIGDAVDLDLVEIEYDTEAIGTVQEEITKAYSVHAVVDQREKCKVPFHEAVEKGIIDQDTGEYVNQLTGAHIPVEEAINKGFIKATLADNPNKISIDSMGSKAAAKGVAAIRKKILSPMKVLSGFKS